VPLVLALVVPEYNLVHPGLTHDVDVDVPLILALVVPEYDLVRYAQDLAMILTLMSLSSWPWLFLSIT
jgi:hypothetical protein